MKIVVVEDEMVVLDDLPVRLHVEEYIVVASVSGENAVHMTGELHPDAALTESIRADEPLWTQAGSLLTCTTAHPDERAWRWHF